MALEICEAVTKPKKAASAFLNGRQVDTDSCRSTTTQHPLAMGQKQVLTNDRFITMGFTAVATVRCELEA